MTPRPLWTVALLAVPVAALSALGPRYGGSLSVGVVDLPAGTEPRAPRTVEESLVAGLVHETLIGVEPDGTLRPGLAAGWDAAAEGREWTLQLREDGLFHDGEPIRSADVVRSLRRFLKSPSVAAQRLARDLDGGAVGVTAPDGTRVVLRFLSPRAVPLAPLSAPGAAITSSRGTGAGPFVPTATDAGRRMALKAFGQHVRGRPYLDTVQLQAFPSSRSFGTEIQAGRLDLAVGRGESGDRVATLLLVLDRTRAPFEDVSRRRAVAQAIDRAFLVQSFWPESEAAPSLLVPVLMPASAGEVPSTGNPGQGRIAMRVSSDVPHLVSQRVVAHLGLLGLEVGAEAVAPREAWDGSAPARLLLWSPEVAEPGLALEELAERVAARGARELLAAAEEERDAGRRRALLQRAEAALREDAALIPLAWAPVPLQARGGIQGLRVDLTGRPSLEDVWILP